MFFSIFFKRKIEIYKIEIRIRTINEFIEYYNKNK